ncbi:sulfatase family protein [Coraliomargarita parva]|uniref:sulfatase family protein n=1 Tax=Coraliomargarita parva TaxID=3014050 RepID=UPI0022B34A8D|nr:sulfatase-like hydrolase/transferase [Coraliomargarita parva]
MKKEAAGSKPNVLWICTDQQRFDTIGALGNPHIRTPNLDKLCKEGVAFNRTYCQNPLCGPSRASFLSGQYMSANHVTRNGNEHYPIEGPLLITRYMADAGYTCGLAGKLHISSAWDGLEERIDDGYEVFKFSHAPHQHAGTNQPGSPIVPVGEPCGNDYIDWLRNKGINLDDVFELNDAGLWGPYKASTDPDLRQTTWCAEEAIDFLTERKESGPWLMSVNMFDPHVPFDAPDAYLKNYDPDTLPDPLFQESDLEHQKQLADAGAFYNKAPLKRPDRASREMKASYYAMIELIDTQVGRMIQALEDTGQRENTVIIFMSDHGDLLGDHSLETKGCRFYEGLAHVPLIISWPGQFREGVQVDDLVELTDVAPTLAELAGVQMKRQHGRSLLGYLELDGKAPEPREFVRSEFFQEGERMEDGRHDNFFATMYYDGRWKLINYHSCWVGELYDLENDPNEFEDLWSDPSVASVKAELTQKSFNTLALAADPGVDRRGRY